MPNLIERSTVINLRYVLTRALILLLLIVAGTAGFMMIEGTDLLASLYMTIITISTVGFGEVQELSNGGRIFVIFLIMMGLGLVTYTLSAVGNLIMEGRFRQILGRRHMMKEISNIKGHYIVCGTGRMGRIICDELFHEKRPFVVVSKDEDDVEEMQERGFLAVHGDATDDEVLLAAGVDRAHSLVAVVSSDVANLYITLSARELNAHIYILARATDEKASRKIKHAGANRALSPYQIGGQSLVQALLRPNVYDFMSVVTSSRGLDVLMQEYRITEGCGLVGQQIRETNLRQEYDLIIIGLVAAAGEGVFNPKPEQLLSDGDTLILLGSQEQMDRLTGSGNLMS
jgi:voltage-gated potassium channel